MIINSTLETVVTVNGEGTTHLGLAVGLTLFFLLIVTVAGAIVYKFQSQIRNVWQSGRRRGRSDQKKTDSPGSTTPADSQHYTNLIREQPVAHSPIYENLSTQTHGYKRPAAHQSRSPREPEEDLYLQCDSPDNAIYGNDPKCNLVICDTAQEEDVYIIPDS